jgi:hypothetical protein
MGRSAGVVQAEAQRVFAVAKKEWIQRGKDQRPAAWETLSKELLQEDLQEEYRSRKHPSSEESSQGVKTPPRASSVEQSYRQYTQEELANWNHYQEQADKQDLDIQAFQAAAAAAAAAAARRESSSPSSDGTDIMRELLKTQGALLKTMIEKPEPPLFAPAAPASPPRRPGLIRINPTINWPTLARRGFL